MRHTLAAATILVLSACGRDTITPPTITTPAPPAPQIAFSLDGVVSDSAFRRVGQAKIEVIDGPQAGAVALSDDTGEFRFAQTFTAALTVRASKAGYLDQSRQVTDVIGHSQLGTGFALESATSSVDFAGHYVVTLSADSACTTLPTVARTRSYSATIVRSGPYYEGTLTSGIFATPDPAGLFHRFTAGVFGSYVNLYINEEFYSIVEQVGPDTDVVISGGAKGDIQGASLDVPFNGSFVYCEGLKFGPYSTFSFECSTTRITCTSENHRLSLTRQ